MHLATQAERKVGQVADRRYAMAAFQVRGGLSARFDAIQEIADVQNILLFGVSRSLQRFGPGGWLQLGNRLRPADRMSRTNAGDNIGRMVPAVGIDFEAGAAKAHAALGAVK